MNKPNELHGEGEKMKINTEHQILKKMVDDILSAIIRITTNIFFFSIPSKFAEFFRGRCLNN